LQISKLASVQVHSLLYNPSAKIIDYEAILNILKSQILYTKVVLRKELEKITSSGRRIVSVTLLGRSLNRYYRSWTWGIPL